MLKSIVVRGKLTKDIHSLQYELGDAEAITSGRWQMAISAITFLIGKDLPWNSVFELRSNYIDTTVATEYGKEKKRNDPCFRATQRNSG